MPNVPPTLLVVRALVERACSLAATDTAPVAEIEHIVRALIEPGSEIASLLESFGVRRGDLRGSEP